MLQNNVRIDVQINMKLELRLSVPSTLDKHNCLCRDENGFVSLSAVHVCKAVTDSYEPRISHVEHLEVDLQAIYRLSKHLEAGLLLSEQNS